MSFASHLHEDRVNLRDFDGVVDWERHFDLLDDWNLNLFVDWILLDVVMVNCVNVIWD
jgi:hypothetical protein